KSPMWLVFRSFGDPAFQYLLLCVGEWVFRCRWRHHFAVIARRGAADQFAFLWLAGHDRALLDSRIANIEPQFRLAGLVVRTVALEAMPRENRPHFANKIDRLPANGACLCEQENQEKHSSREEQSHRKPVALKGERTPQRRENVGGQAYAFILLERSAI